MKLIEKIAFKDGCSLEIHQEEDPTNPRTDWDSCCVMVCFHKRYDLGDKHVHKREDYNGWEELREAIQQDNPDCLIRPMYLMDHSGLSISLKPFGCPWDSGQVGFIFITKENIVSEFSGDVFKAEQYLIGEVEAYDQYLRGDVYEYVLRNKPCDKCGGKGKVIDSCGGFYGNNLFENGILDHIDNKYREEIMEAIK